MDDGAAGELTALRMRAYGPTADIAADPAARARLAELEARERAERTPVQAPPRPPAPAHPPVPSLPSDVAEESDRLPRPTTLVGAPTPRAALPDHTRRVLWAAAWVGSLAAVATVATAVTSAASAQFAWPATAMSDRGVSLVAQVRVDPDGTIPLDYVNNTQPTVYESFDGLTAFTFSFDHESGSSSCIAVVPTGATDPGMSGAFAQGCSAGAFPATAALEITEEAPSALRERFPVGSSLQFVLGDDRVDIYAAEAPPAAET